MGYSFKALDTRWIHSSVTSYLQAGAADSLASAAASKNDYITINSAFRTSAEQYLLYQWYQKKMCGITLAAQPGSSNHEGGRAIDTSNYNYWLNTLANYGWVHTYPSSDPVHFDNTKFADIRSKNLLAFQRIYNRNNPNAKISEDGQYGPQTENALYHAPCDGW
jgi:N-acetylmuramoyl-L-alanine amidase